MEEFVQRPYKGLYLDCSYTDQPEGTYRFLLNGIQETKEGDQNFRSNEQGNVVSITLPSGYKPIGHSYMIDDSFVLFSVNPETKKSGIGIGYKDHRYEHIVDTSVLNFSLSYQIDSTYRVRRGTEQVVYFTDGYNKPYFFNFKKLRDFYSFEYIEYLDSHNNDGSGYTGEKWSKKSFTLIQFYTKIPSFESIKVEGNGSILSGSYSFGIFYVDENTNSTECINTSEPVNIYVDSLNDSFRNIRGSNNKTEEYEQFGRANKSISVTFGNIDTDFAFYRVAIIQRNAGEGNVNKVLLSNLIPTSNPTFVYRGQDTQFSETSLEDLAIFANRVDTAQHIEQLENRLILANITNKRIDYLSFQQYASKIGNRFISKEVIINEIKEINDKNPTGSYESIGYMPGEVYSFGIVYVFNDGEISPVYHIPGTNKYPNGSVNGMKEYNCISTYPPIHKNDIQDYWGVDIHNNSLEGQPIRHHKFPFRNESNLPITFSDDINSSNSQKVYKSNMFGIRFFNIIKPHPDVIGYYIVRNESTISERIVVDNGFTGPMVWGETHEPRGTQSDDDVSDVQQPDADNYISFAHFNPKINPRSGVKESENLLYLFSPEYEFNHERVDHQVLRFEGEFSINNEFWGNKIIRDVQGGTSYNKEAHDNDDKDDDGFALALRYGAFDVSKYNFIDKTYNPTNTYYLSAGAYQQVEKSIIYNASMDNKIIAINIGEDKPSSFQGKLHYVNLINNTQDAYANFISLSYYKEQNNITYLADGWSQSRQYLKDDLAENNNIIYIALRDNIGVEPNSANEKTWKILQDNNGEDSKDIYHGDAHVSFINPVSSLFISLINKLRKRKKKSWWQYVVGAAAIVVGAVVTIFTAGIASAVGVALIGLGATFVFAGIQSGMKLEALQNAVEIHYKTGLLETVCDSNVINNFAITSTSSSTPYNEKEVGDDTILWWFNALSNVAIESRLNIYLRTGYTYGTSDFLNTPYTIGGGLKNVLNSATLGTYDDTWNYGDDEFIVYLTNKMTVIDRENAEGRLYRQIPVPEVYNINPDYATQNKEKIFSYLPLEYTTDRDKPENFNHRVMYSEQSYQEEIQDNFRIFLPNNYKDIEGEFGEITDIIRKDNKLYIFTKESFWHLPQNLQQQVTGELLTIIGTGEFFAIPPIRILDEKSGGGGTSHKWATTLSRYGISYVSEIEGKVYLFDNQLNELSLEGISKWFKNNLKEYFNKQWYNKFKNNYNFLNNPSNNIGIHAIQDTETNRLLITKKDYAYLGDWNKVHYPIESDADYPLGDIIVDEEGIFQEVGGAGYGELIDVNFNSWQLEETSYAKIELPIKTDIDNPMLTQHGYIWDNNDGSIIYKSKRSNELDWTSGDTITDVVTIGTGDCGLNGDLIFNMSREYNMYNCNTDILINMSEIWREEYRTDGYQVRIYLGPIPEIENNSRITQQFQFLLGNNTQRNRFDVYLADMTDNNLIWTSKNLFSADEDGRISTVFSGTYLGYRMCEAQLEDAPASWGTRRLYDMLSGYPPAGNSIPYRPERESEKQFVTLHIQDLTPDSKIAVKAGCICDLEAESKPSMSNIITDWNYCATCRTLPGQKDRE